MKRSTSKKAMDKQALFATAPVSRALFTMAVPTIISQLINVVYNMVDAAYIGRTGNAYMMAATSLTITLVMMNTALSNLFGIGGGSLVARLMGARKAEEARRVSAFGAYGGICIALLYAGMFALFSRPVLRFLGASDATMGYAASYATIVIALGSLPSILSMVLAHLLRNAGFSAQASIGLSCGGILNVLLDPLFMFVLLPKGQEVTGAAIATTLSNYIACAYLLIAYRKASFIAPLGMSPADARRISRESARAVFTVGVPSAVLVALFDLANIFVVMISAAHDDLVLAGMGIVMKVERIPNAVNIGLCQGMLPIVAFNFSSGNHARMKEVIHKARITGLAVSAISIVCLELLADPFSRFFLNTNAAQAEAALKTVGYAALFLRIRCLASPVQFINYNSSYCMQAMGNGRRTLLHAFVRELMLYIPFMFILDRAFGAVGLAAALPAGESCGAVFALFLLNRTIREAHLQS